MRKAWRAVASFFWIGYFPIAPGTAASLVIALVYKFFLSSLAWPLISGLFLFLLFLGVFASGSWAGELGRRDPGVIVIDEVCGQLFVLLFVPPLWIPILFGFVLFRVFDILKPYPISKAEDLNAGWGIMADDLAAAVLAKAVLHIYLYLK